MTLKACHAEPPVRIRQDLPGCTRMQKVYMLYKTFIRAKQIRIHSNLASQGYFEDDIGRHKVNATADLCQNINHHLEIHEIKERFRRSMKIGNVVFCAVDQIETRRLIWDAVKDKVNFFCDGRMSAEVLRILAACDSTSRKHYPNTLFGSGEAFVGPCTAKTTIYCANIAAGLMLAQFTRCLRQLPIDCDIQLNLLASELNVGGGR